MVDSQFNLVKKIIFRCNPPVPKHCFLNSIDTGRNGKFDKDQHIAQTEKKSPFYNPIDRNPRLTFFYRILRCPVSFFVQLCSQAEPKSWVECNDCEWMNGILMPGPTEPRSRSHTECLTRSVCPPRSRSTFHLPLKTALNHCRLFTRARMHARL